MTAPVRGQVYRADIGVGPKPWLIISNNSRNRSLSTVLAARITTTSKGAELQTWVQLSSADPLVGYVVADDLMPIRKIRLQSLLGTVAPATILAVNTALKLAQAIP
ncbi:type II toxin-antitoxin system PemK/MazF family toxin [Nocardia panacis]|uniref:Type II toxin-antitoxin system PemK/MazF family toxin n=1 Tax=Nocardia panacis TaxID=2340916 RepID=A0A3A4K7L0_9NOCA|nr:type II toxin-antitoxin system PemK/MazF family toxin [Nocardia panacis]RJO69158.1 type II toxin-antitoxin system PemK/MazF family toxin [Nocardia panacis]